MATILGISCYYHDSAAVLVKDGDILAAAQEERFTRVKHDAGFPRHATEFCLNDHHLTPGDLDAVVFYEKPLQKFDRLLESYLAFTPIGFRSFVSAIPNWLKEKLYHPRLLRKGIGSEYTKAFLFTGHHEAHAASAFYPSPFDQAAVLTIDGVGEWDTASLWIGHDRELKELQTLHFPHSLGLLYSAFTYYLGFRVNSGEYKVMGLAPYGNPVFSATILDHLIDLKPDGSFALDMKYFNYATGLTMTSPAFHRLFGGSPRQPESPITRKTMDIAASLQKVAEMIILNMARHARHTTGQRNLCLAGGVALNSVANGLLQRSGIFDKIWIQPAAGDAGGALGCAMLAAHRIFDDLRHVNPDDSMKGAFLGPSYDDHSIRSALDQNKLQYRTFTSEPELLHFVCTHLQQGHVIGWFNGRMEFGPRALGSRSILADPRNVEMQQRLNLKIKYRESFRPFAPVILEEKLNEYFDLTTASPYMLLVDQVKSTHCHGRTPPPETDDETYIRELLRVPRSTIPAVTHVDGSARIQTADPRRHGRFYRLLREWETQTGIPVLVNTSFNIRGEPIVCAPGDAIRCFMGTHMDILVMENFIVTKKDNPSIQVDALDYAKSYPLD